MEILKKKLIQLIHLIQNNLCYFLNFNMVLKLIHCWVVFNYGIIKLYNIK